MSHKELVHDILSKALDADEKGDKELAIDFYTKAVELVLKISDPTLKERLNKYAIQALERAEELKGISASKRRSDETHPPGLRIQSKYFVHFFYNGIEIEMELLQVLRHQGPIYQKYHPEVVILKKKNKF